VYAKLNFNICPSIW